MSQTRRRRNSLIKPAESAKPVSSQRKLSKQDQNNEDFQDRLTLQYIREPVVASDDGLYDAKSVLDIFNRAGGMSLIDTEQRITSVTYCRDIKNVIDRTVGEHKDRIAKYDLAPVMSEIRNWLETNADESVDMAVQHRLLPEDVVSEEMSDDEPVHLQRQQQPQQQARQPLVQTYANYMTFFERRERQVIHPFPSMVCALLAAACFNYMFDAGKDRLNQLTIPVAILTFILSITVEITLRCYQSEERAPRLG